MARLGADRPPLRFPDRLIAIDGEPVPAPRTLLDLPARAIGERFAALRAGGHTEVTLTWQTHEGPKTMTRALHALGANELLFSSRSTRWSVCSCSGPAWRCWCWRGARGAVAYAFWSVGTFVFLATFLDYHAAAWLAPLFSLSTVWVSVCVVWLAYSFPEPPRTRRRVLRGAAVAFTACGAAAAALLIIGPFLRLDLRPLRVVVTAVAFPTLLVLSGSILYRLRVERDRRRPELRSSAIGLAVVPALVAFGFLMMVVTGTPIIHIVLPFLRRCCRCRSASR